MIETIIHPSPLVVKAEERISRDHAAAETKEKTAAQNKPASHAHDMKTRENVKDDQDAEFERY
ncbi:MAG: hypothetical protein RBT80_05150 [Candidatus Vecturithrix sp.]|nr:hypothetical protein [Candidatus Vecturithrix sp.]